MSVNPQQIQQMLAQYNQNFTPQQNQQLAGFDAAQAQLGQGAPMGTNRQAGAVNGASQLLLALIKAKKMQQLQQQQKQQTQPAPTTPATPVPSGTSLSNPGGDDGESAADPTG
jgi:hypothetical protein